MAMAATQSLTAGAVARVVAQVTRLGMPVKPGFMLAEVSTIVAAEAPAGRENDVSYMLHEYRFCLGGNVRTYSEESGKSTTKKHIEMYRRQQSL